MTKPTILVQAAVGKTEYPRPDLSYPKPMPDDLVVKYEIREENQ